MEYDAVNASFMCIGTLVPDDTASHSRKNAFL
jgi:hypothetical protein